MDVENSIHIDASAEAVWAVTVDVDRWPEWTPTVTALTRKDTAAFGLGSVARIKQPMQPMAEWTVTEFTAGQRFVWETRRLGLHMVGGHEMFPDGAGTRNVLHVKATGVFAVMLWPLLRLAIRHALSAENHGLKLRCEAALHGVP
jgi:Polyketide cyclase / dehydrase and lipid transport